MKTYKRIIFTVCLIFSLVSCEVISEDERYEPVIVENSRRVVLLEEFTGVRCTNCPKAAKIAHDLLTQYPENIVVIGLHGENTGNYGTPFEGEQDFRIPESKEYFTYFGGTATQGYPCGMVNRSKNSNTILADGILMNYDVWATEVVRSLLIEPSADIYLELVEDSSLPDSVIKVNVTIETLKEIDFPVSLNVQVTEDNIKGSQVDGGHVNESYVHNHVLRCAVNGTWGESVTMPSVGNKTQIKEYIIDIKKPWVKENCSIVAYLYNSETKEDVIQAKALSLGNKTNH